MRTEEEIRKQIKTFEDEIQRYLGMYSGLGDDHNLRIHTLYHIEAVEREIEVLYWVLSEGVFDY